MSVIYNNEVDNFDVHNFSFLVSTAHTTLVYLLIYCTGMCNLTLYVDNLVFLNFLGVEKSSEN